MDKSPKLPIILLLKEPEITLNVLVNNKIQTFKRKLTNYNFPLNMEETRTSIKYTLNIPPEKTGKVTSYIYTDQPYTINFYINNVDNKLAMNASYLVSNDGVIKQEKFI